MLLKNLRVIFTVYIIILLLLGCTKKDQIRISSKQEEFTVSLPANPTTGFQWSITEFDKNIFELKNHQYLSSKVGMLGSGGEMLYTFKLKKQTNYPRKSLMKFKYSRSWEPESATVRSVDIYIDKR